MTERNEPKAEPVPWSPLGLTLLALFFGPGAIVVAFRNLELLGVLDRQSSRFYAWGSVVLLAALFLVIWSLNPALFQRSPQQQLLPVSIGAPFAVYLIQLAGYQRWRSRNAQVRMRPWYTALPGVIAMTLMTAILAVLGIGIFAAVFNRPS